MKKNKYKLTLWQRLELIPIWFLWYFHADRSQLKSWHEIKKGMEKHECKFTKPFSKGKYDFLECEHEGCKMCESVN
jgi:hypothetical protein